MYQGQKERAQGGKEMYLCQSPGDVRGVGRVKFEATIELETLASQVLRKVPSALCLKRDFPLWGRYGSRIVSMPEKETLPEGGPFSGDSLVILKVSCPTQT